MPPLQREPKAARLFGVPLRLLPAARPLAAQEVEQLVHHVAAAPQRLPVVRRQLQGVQLPPSARAPRVDRLGEVISAQEVVREVRQ